MTTRPDETERPDFMAALGLLPPYTIEDVRMAYREKAKLLHPDRGGSVVAFQKLKEAFDRASEYAEFRVSRRNWLAAQVERYTQQEVVVGEVRRLRGQVEIEQIDWVKRSIGEDFAVVTERLRGIRLRGLTDGDAFLRYLAEHRPVLGYLNWLDLANSKLSDEGLRPLRALPELRRLNLAGTSITKRGMRTLVALHHLEWLNLAGTAVGWWTRWRLQWSYPRLRLVTVPAE